MNVSLLTTALKQFFAVRAHLCMLTEITFFLICFCAKCFISVCSMRSNFCWSLRISSWIIWMNIWSGKLFLTSWEFCYRLVKLSIRAVESLTFICSSSKKAKLVEKTVSALSWFSVMIALNIFLNICILTLRNTGAVCLLSVDVDCTDVVVCKSVSSFWDCHLICSNILSSTWEPEDEFSISMLMFVFTELLRMCLSKKAKKTDALT